MVSFKHASLFLAIVRLGCATGVSAADFAVSGLFGPGAVIQHGAPVPVFGIAAPGQKVTVTLQDETAEAVADGHGRWQAKSPLSTPAVRSRSKRSGAMRCAAPPY